MLIFVACVASLRNVNNAPGRLCCRYLPAEVKIHHNDSGYFLWLELPEPLDAGELSLVALTHHISIAPGNMFSTGENWSRFFRFNTAWQWGEREEQAVKQLGKLIQERL